MFDLEDVLDWFVKPRFFGSMYRPINEVDRNEISFRKIWWEPTKRKPFPNILKLTLVFAAALLSFAGSALVGIVGLGLIGYYLFNLRKKNSVPVEATKLNILRSMQQISMTKAESQSKIDLTLSDEEFKEALNSRFIFTLATGAEPITIWETTTPIFRILNYTTVVMTSRGIGFHSTTYDVMNDTYYPGESEMMLWSRIARVIRSGRVLKIEATSGSSREFDLGHFPLTQEINDEEKVINTYIHPFVQEAQKNLGKN